MSLVSIAQETLSQEQKIPMSFLEALKDKYPDLPTAEEMGADEDLTKFLEPVKSGRKKKTPEERRGQYNEEKCDARIWKNAGKGMGYDNIQCGSKKIGGCFCKKHQASEDGGGWWLGKIREPRPVDPFGPPGSKNPRDHIWNTDAEGNEIVKEKKERKSPKKSGKKSSGKKDPHDMDIEELKMLLASKEKEPVEEVKEEDPVEEVKAEKLARTTKLEAPDENETVIVDGKEYQLCREDNIVIDPDDMEIMGTWNAEEEKIDFEDEDMAAKHQPHWEKCQE